MAHIRKCSIRSLILDFIRFHMYTKDVHVMPTSSSVCLVTKEVCQFPGYDDSGACIWASAALGVIAHMMTSAST